jgi:capsular polysaccharide biosynthesis protein
MEQFFDLHRIFKTLWKWKVQLLIVTLIAIVAAAVISSPLFIKPKYKSSARIYPVNIAEYSEESESEQLLEFVNSTDLKFRVVDALKLDEVYKISKEDPLYRTYILAEFNKNIGFKKTEYETVEIRALDQDPQRACNIVDTIIHYYNKKIQTVHGQKYLEVADIAKRDLALRQKEVDSLFSRIDSLRKNYGLLDYDAQVEAASMGLYEGLAAKNPNPKAEKMLENLRQAGGEFLYLQNRLKAREKVIDSLQVEYDWAISHATKEITYSLVVEHPFPSDKKAYPVRWLIVLVSMIAAFAFASLTVLVIEYIRESSHS